MIVLGLGKEVCDETARADPVRSSEQSDKDSDRRATAESGVPNGVDHMEFLGIRQLYLSGALKPY